MKAPRLAIRFKVPAVILLVLLLAFGTYLYLATSLFTQDKLAYVHDLIRAVASSGAEQTGSHLDLLRRKGSRPAGSAAARGFNPGGWSQQPCVPGGGRRAICCAH